VVDEVSWVWYLAEAKEPFGIDGQGEPMHYLYAFFHGAGHDLNYGYGDGYGFGDGYGNGYGDGLLIYRSLA
jgi:hypothetical protein